MRLREPKQVQIEDAKHDDPAYRFEVLNRGSSAGNELVHKSDCTMEQVRSLT